MIAALRSKQNGYAERLLSFGEREPVELRRLDK
jgi:hypothetical protein